MNPSRFYHGVASPSNRGLWSQEEHDRFLDAIKLFPNGPWKAIATHVGTRSVRQVQTHAQKYQEKVARRERGLQKNRRKVVRCEHRVDEDTYAFVHRKGRRVLVPFMRDHALVERLQKTRTEMVEEEERSETEFDDDALATRSPTSPDESMDTLDFTTLDAYSPAPPELIDVKDVLDVVPSTHESLDFLLDTLMI
ncbi:hypothetical protein PINS_up015326 [Pythium insidiosum]|nr:hypothetical protein PINS_up015326 [Pythium insidiosum]